MLKKHLLGGAIAAALSFSAHADFTYRVPMGMDFSASAPQGLTGISCGLFHCYGLKGGTIWAVGNNYYKQLGIPSVGLVSVWTDTGQPATYVAAGHRNGYAIHNDTIWVVGHNSVGELGLGHKHDRDTWTDSGAAGDTVVAGDYHAYALVDGTVWAVGRNNYGQQAKGNTSDNLVWSNTNLQATAIAAGAHSGYAISNGTVWVVGQNGSGQLGMNDTSRRLSWVNSEQPAEKIVAGALFAYAISGGNLYSVGSNTYGQLGRTDVCAGSGCSSPVWTATGQTATDAAAGSYFGYIIKNDEVWSVGFNGNGQLGRNETQCLSCKSINWGNTGQSATHITARYNSGYLMNGSVIMSTGANGSGQLGLGDQDARNAFAEVTVPE
ncbi:RCC1 domain-containing protein [Neptuniibacter sp. QD37_11]|uniref:RCC1 domain-containing protein n=1 Tax=Neptuniibacter sp. QD37_11 TaxID=3398209 RepID=UPI0039F53B16